ncbi:MAG: hypothetical protein H0U85_04810 [Gemmatimonadales bacterium]|nr:hypothetical protein [Gemmatimonadales bacterium]
MRLIPLIGFVLLTYRNPPQTLRLIHRLNRSFDDPPIALHHDFGQCSFPVDQLPGNVSVVQPHRATGWGTFGTVEAFIAALDSLMGRRDSPDWFVFLSGSDYPIQPGERIRRELGAAVADAFMDIAHINPFALGRDTAGSAFGREWHHLAFMRWFGTDVRLPRLTSSGRLEWRSSRPKLQWLPVTHGPFRGGFRCYGGEATITANRRTALRILEFHARKPALAEHYSERECVDESYLHCIIGNSPELRVVKDSRRFTDWTERKRHPRTLTTADLPALVKSNAHFARKFDPEVDAAVLDRLDEMLN